MSHWDSISATAFMERKEKTVHGEGHCLQSLSPVLAGSVNVAVQADTAFSAGEVQVPQDALEAKPSLH